jgi:hypothetical protein
MLTGKSDKNDFFLDVIDKDNHTRILAIEAKQKFLEAKQERFTKLAKSIYDIVKELQARMLVLEGAQKP